MLKKIIPIFVSLPFLFGFSYLIRIPFLKGSLNLLDVLILFSFFLIFFYTLKSLGLKESKKKLNEFFKKNLPLFIFLIFLNLSILFSSLANWTDKNFLNMLGYYKSLFLLPIFFVLGIKFFKEKNILFLNPLIFFISYFIYSGVVGLLGIFYLINNLLTFDQRLKIFFQSPNQLAMTLAAGILIGFFLLTKNRNKFIHWLIAGTVLLEIFCLYSTQSQGALIGTVLGIIVIGLFNYKKIWRKIFFFSLLTITVISTLWIISLAQNKFSVYDLNTKTNSSLSRLAIWQAGAKINWDYFPLGIGLGNFEEKYLAYQKFFPAYPQWAVPHSHNFWLNLSIEIGFLGFICIFIISFKNFYSALFKKNPLNILQASLLAYFLIHSLIDMPFAKNDWALLFWVLIFI